MERNSAENEIAFIKKIIADSRQVIIDDGKGFIAWGILIILGLVITYLDIFLISGAHFNIYAWIFIAIIGWSYSFYEKKKYISAKARTFAGKILGMLWFSAGIGMTLVGFVGPYFGIYHPAYISPLIAVILGMTYNITGVIYSLKWISYLSIGWWTGAIIMFMLSGVENIIIMASMMLLLQVVPGIILYKQAKKSQKLNLL